MKKIFAILLAVSALSLVLSGCKSGDDAGTTGDTGTTAGGTAGTAGTTGS